MLALACADASGRHQASYPGSALAADLPRALSSPGGQKQQRTATPQEELAASLSAASNSVPPTSPRHAPAPRSRPPAAPAPQPDWPECLPMATTAAGSFRWKVSAQGAAVMGLDTPAVTKGKGTARLLVMVQLDGTLLQASLCATSCIQGEGQWYLRASTALSASNRQHLGRVSPSGSRWVYTHIGAHTDGSREAALTPLASDKVLVACSVRTAQPCVHVECGCCSSLTGQQRCRWLAASGSWLRSRPLWAGLAPLTWIACQPSSWSRPRPFPALSSRTWCTLLVCCPCHTRS